MQKPTAAKVRGMIAKGNGLAKSAISVTWSKAPRLVTYPTGLRGYYGIAKVEAPGFRTRDMIVTADSDGTMV